MKIIRKIWSRICSWSLPTKISLILGLIGIVAIFFYPFFYNETSSIWSILFVGPKIIIEAQYPQISNNQTLITYTNIGGTPLENIHIEYTFKLNENIDILSKTFIGVLSKKYLSRGESGTFLATLKGVNSTRCDLINPIDPSAKVYTDNLSDNCYFQVFNDTRGGFCSPAKINLTIISSQKTFYKEFYYPVSVYSRKSLMWMEESPACEEINNVTANLTFFVNVPFQGSVEDYGLNDSIKLSKKYCSERLMPLSWCVENNFG